MAAIARHHPLERELHAEDDSVDVDVHHAPCGEIVLVDEAPDLHDPGVVDKHVHGPELLFGPVEERRERFALRDVERQRHGAGAELGGSLLGRGKVDVADRHLHSLTQERLRRCLADPARRAGDRRGLAGEDTGLLGHALSS